MFDALSRQGSDEARGEAVYWLARDQLKEAWLAVAFAAIFLLFPALQAATLDEFHPVTLVPPLLLFAFYFLVRGKTALYFTFLLLALGCKENISLKPTNQSPYNRRRG